ncbi:endonuclease VII domain-containing protein [Micromonospora sp. NBC_01655]|uniref:endonuclease domain-containing protein n=1 Tax=Micromonospora sp. NBC_01655 TaxID=2975983 RepID=UPI0022530688|nr:endonuclease domain-containing protein [Micromonospora sp. NBC_01655]MCX4470473.1 endonuclease VII domain-containing protein [Micromonospora sp. NBC_01655]
MANEAISDIFPGLSAFARELILEGRDEGLSAIEQWQQQRCAICAAHQPGRLVLDHDHTTALVRGYLCRSCNVREAHTYGPFELYRQRNPATILGVSSVYESIFGVAKPAAPVDPDLWRKNPASGIGL